MAEESDLSRTEPASARRLQAAREAGDVPRSAELTASVVLLSALGVLGWLAPRLIDALRNLTAAALTQAATPLSPSFLEAAQAAAWAVLPVLATIFVAALVAPMLLSGWVYAPQITRADFSRAYPFRPLARLFSADAWFNGSLAILRLALVGGAVGWALSDGWPGLPEMARAEQGTTLPVVAGWVGHGVIAVAAALTAAAALDAGWRWWRYLRRHAMTWQELVAEAREAEGSPEMRARVRQRQQQAGQGPRPLPPSEGKPSPDGEGANARPKAIDEVIG